MNDNARKLYDALSVDYDMGTFEQFSKDVQDKEKRQKLYDAISEEYDLGDFDSFSRQLIGDVSSAEVSQPAKSQPIGLPGNPYGLGTTFQPTTQVAQPTAQATQPTPQPQVVEQAKATNQERASGKATETPTAPSAPKAEATTPTATASATPMVEATTPVAEQPKSVAAETPTQETEQSTTPLSVQRDMAEQKGEEVVTGVQEKTELPADEYWATHAKELGRLVPQAPQGYVVDNMPQFVTVGMLNNFYSNQYDAKVSGVIYNAIKRNMTKDGVEPTEEDIKAKIATMSEDAIANALNNEDKNAIYALKEEFKRADSNKNNASAMISKVIDATPEEDRKQEGVFLEIHDNMLAEALSNVVNGTDKDLEEYIASEDYNKVYRKAIADWANVKELFGEEAYNNTINGTGLDQYVHLGSMWRKMFGVVDGTNYPKQYEDLVTSKMRDVYSAEDKKGALDNLYNAIGTIDSYIDVKNKLSQEELDAVLAQVNTTIPWGSKLASWDDAFFYNHSKDAEVPYAMTAEARALMALNDYTDNVTMARANDGAIKTLEEQIQKRAEENRAKAQEQVNANPLKYSNEILLTPNSFASNFGIDTEYDYLNSALEIRKEAKEYKDNASVDEGFVANLWRGLTDKALDLGTWDFGLGEFKEAGMLMAITNKSDKGEALTAGEEAFLDAIATRLATFATTKATKGYSTGASTAESLAFMLEFAITPIKGGGALANKFARMMIAKYGKTMARKQAIKYSIGKGLAYVGGDLMKAGGMTATTGLPSVVADAMMRNIGDVSYTQMNDGSIVALRNNDGSIKTTTTKKIDGVETTTEGGESWGAAIKNAFLSRTATNMSEAIGAYLPGKAFAKTVGNKLGLAKLVKAYDKMSATDWAKAADRFFKKTQWNGFGQEYIEELVDGTLQALITQDTSVSDVFEAENLIDTALAVGVMSVLMSGAKTMGYRTASYQLKQDINNTTITGQDLFGKSEWAQIQSAIDGSTADNMSANVQSLINNNELSAPQKKTILRYAMQVAERDALLTNEDKQALAYEGETNIDNTARLQANAYQGYHTTDAKEQFITNQQYIEKGKAVANMLGGEDADQSLQQRYKTNGSYELADKVSHDTSLDVKQKQTILDYLGAKEKVASMGARAQNDINNATINVGREVERKSNIQTGDILTVTHKYDGKQYYVIDGNIVTNQDGSINLDETTDDIIVEDAETGQRMMMSPKMFAEAQLKPSGIKDAMREELNRRAEAYNNTIKYGHTLAVGSNITLRNAEGVDENKTIASVDNNAGVVTFADGRTTTLDAIAEDARLRYSNQYPPSAVKPVVATKEEAQAENVGEPVVAEVATTESVEEEPTTELEDVATPSPTPTPTEYNQEEQVVFIDDNGNRIEGEIVSEVDADGKVLIEDADGGIHQVATSQIVERIGATPAVEAQGDNNVEPTTDATSEGGSQEILDNSNEVGTTTPTAETPTQSTPLTEIPTDEKGKKQYEQASVEDTINDIYNDPELDEEDADAYVQARIDGASKRIAQLEKKKPKMGEDIPGFKAERAKWREQLEAQQASLAYWQGVQEAVPEVRRRERARQQMEADLAEQERARQARAEQALRAEERGRNRGDYRKAMAQWNDTPGSFYEYVVQELLAGDYKMRWDDNGSTRGLGSHTTGRRNRNRKGEVKTSRGAEYNALRWLIDNNGISPEALADRLWNDYSDSYGEEMSGVNPLDVLLDVITSMPTPQMMWDYVKGEHDARMEAEQGIEEQFTEAEIEAMERDAMYRDKYGVSEEEYWSQEAQWDEFIESRDMSAEELGNYDNFVAEQRIKEEYERRNQENAEDEQRSNNSESERGTDVLSGTQSDNTRGNGDVAGESEGIDGSSVEQDDVAQEEARLSEEDRQAIENMPIPMLKQQIKETTTTLINISQLSSEWQEKNRDNIERAKLILAYAKEELARKEGLKKSNKWGIKIGNSATPFSVVRKMFGEFNSNEDIAQLFDKVAKVFESLPIKIVFSDTIGSKGTQGWFSPTTATLKLPGHFVYGGRSLEQSKAETILHEMIHAVTTYALYINEKPHLQTDLGFRLSDDMHAAIRQLKRIYASIASDKDFKGEYGATSVHEMVAELSNVQFRDKLKKKNLWETIVDAIKQLFGIKPSNALEGAEAALEYMLNNFDRRQWDKMANMRGKRNKQLMIENTTGLVDTPASRSLEVEERTMLNRLAKALGVEIEVVPTMAEANAKIVGNKITLALDAEQGAKKALGHELLHRIKALSPEAYEEFAQVIEAINPRAFEQAMIDVRLMYSRAGRTKSREALREEVVADMAGELMYKADLMERFVDALETKSFKEQILNVIKSVFDAIKGIFKGADARAIAKAERVLYNAMKRANMVVNQGNTTEADSANEKLSIIGERGAIALDKAEEATHRMENLDMARKMERYGYPKKSIRMATGWERGADGKWRYEIEDIKLKKEWEPYLWGEGVKLSEIVVGGELFKAYPELKNLTIRYDVNTQSLAYLDWEEQLIGVNPYNLHDSYPSVVHEIQHAIQEIEGFAKGGNSTMLNDRLSAQLNSLTATINKLRAEGKNKEADAIQKRYRGLAEAVINNSEDDYGNYRKLGGEVESRNAEHRIGMTPEQRRATLLAETEDVAREDQIFLVENSGVSAMAEDTKYSLRTNSQEVADIVAKAKADGTYMKAPNGEPTNLTEEQWANVRTKAFKDWFGDWELANLYNRAVNAWNNKNSKGKCVFGLSEKAREQFNELLGNDARQLIITDDAIRHIKNNHGENEELRGQKNITPEDVVVIPYLINNFDSMELNPEFDDKLGNKAVEIRKRINGVSIVATIERGKNKEFLVSNYQFIKSDAIDASKETPGPNVRNDSDIANVRKEIETIKENAKNSSKIVDENGEPMVVYHGTESDFNVFDRTKGRASMDIQGMFFSPWELDAQGYGRNVRAFYLNIRKPSSGGQSYKALNRYQGQMYAGVKARDYLIGLGYDGVDNYGEEFIAFEPNQIKSATDNVEFGEGDDIRYSLRSDTPFYSNAEYAVENIKQGKATPEQWLAMIQKNGGLKAGEDKWLGLSDWLKASDAKTLTKEEVLEFINQNKIKIEEVGYSQFGEGFIDEATKKLEAELKEVGWDEMENRYPGFGEYFEMYGNELVWSEEKAGIGEYEDFILDNKILTPDAQDNAINETRERYTTEGLENKKEIALVVPSVDPYNAHDEIHFGDAGGGRAVAWIRFGETTDADGNRVLVIDEIQSKRHQDGREKGYRSAEMDKRAEEARKAYIEADNAFNQFRKQLMEKYNYSSLVQGTAEERREGRKIWRSKFTPEEMAKYNQLHNKVIDTLAAHDSLPRQISRVPDAPFDKNWHELAMKRMLRYAAENGFDKVAWTTGAQQAERYDIGTLVNHVHVINSEEERYVSVSPNSGRIIEMPTKPNSDIITSGEYKGQRLQDVFGKELAEKILSVEIGNDVRIAGEDLRIGGEGMKGFYDKMLPSFMNKYGKKWGVKVGEVTMPELQEGYQTMHSIDVTDAMKESVMEGQPLFRDGSGALSDADLSYVNDPFAKALGKSQRSKAKQAKFAERERKAMRTRVAELVEKLGIGESVELIEGGEFDNERKARAKGWYDAKSGKIVINLANHTSVADIERTLLHEAVSHHGLRELFGKQFDTFLDNVFRSADYNIRTQIVDLATRNGWDFRTATEEYLAQLAEDTNFDALENNWSFWSKIKQLFMDMLESIGWNYQGPTLTDNELRYLLWRSWENMVNPGRHRSILGMAEDVVKREKFGIGTYSTDENIESQVAEGEDVKYSLRDNQGNPIDEDGKLIVEQVSSIDEITDADFDSPTRSIQLPSISPKVDEAIGANGKPIVIKKNVFEKNKKSHKDLTPKDSRAILLNTLYSPDLYGQNQKITRPYNWILIHLADTNTAVLVEVNENKDNVEIVNWHYINDDAIERKKKQAIREGGLILTLESAAADTSNFLPSANKVNNNLGENQENDTKYSLRSKGVLHPDLTDTDGTRAKYNERVGSRGFKWREGYQDSMLSLKVLQEIIAEKHGLKEIPSWQNAYVEENEMSSRNKAMSDMYQRDFFKPLMAEVKRLIDKEGLKYEDIVTYLMAKHGLERNAVKAIEAAEQLADESMPKSADGKIDRDSNEWKKAFNEAYRETSKRDFSGLRGLFKTADMTIATGNAQMVVERMEQAVDTNALWNVIRSATNETLDIQRKGGLISKATYETLRDKYQFYIPLRGFNEKTAKDEYEYLTSSVPLLPPTMKRAKGRASMADDPLAHIGMLADSAIIQANRNKMKQAFYHFVVNNPSSVASVSEQWYVRNETTGRWESRNPIIPNGASADEMAEILTQFEAEMKELASNKKARRKRGDIKTDFITLPYQASEHEVRVKINGRDYTIYINGNPRAAQALNGLTNPEQFNDIITKGGKVINNFMAQMFTSKNPAFIVTNMARDLQWATNAVMVKEGFAYQKEYFKSLAEATKVLTMIAKHNKGILDMDDKTQRYFEEFLRYGGETGYTAINQIEEYKKNVERLVKDAKGVTTLPAKSWHALVDGIEYLNRSAEDFTRFAVYMASREMGRTPERSAHDAKEITVNFNKKGSGVMGARYFSAAYIFFNASLQSLNNMARMFKHHPIKMSGAMSVPALVGFALPVILKAWMGDDDDEMYNNLPDWVRRNNIVFPFFGNTFLTIPLPYEMRPFYTMGTVAYDVIFNGYDAIEGLRDVALGFADMLPIDFAGNGGNIFVNMTPTFFQPVAQIMANVDYFGKPIYKKSEFYENDPEHSIAFKGTSPILIEASRLINAIGGGNDYRLGAVEKGLGSMKMLNNPDVWEHLIDSYFGGVGKTAMRTIKTAQIIYGEALELFGKENKFAELNEVRNYPVLSSFVAGGEERTGAQYKITEQYYELLDKAKDYKEDLGDYKRAAIHDMKYAEELVEFMNTPESKEARVVLGYDTYRNILKKHLDLVDERRLDEINRAMADAMQEMLEAVKNAQSMTNEEILKKNSELVGKAKDLIYQKGDSVLDKNKGRLALLDAAVKYSNDDILEELLNNEQ